MNLDNLKPLQKWLKEECNLPFSLTELFNLKVLKLSNKKLTSIHPDINLLTSLQRLDCSYNLLTRLEFNCPNLQTLFCHNNLLTRLEFNCPNLQTLFCHNNLLTRLEFNCPNLQILHCANNPFAIKINSLSHKLFAKFKFKDYNIMEESKITELL